MASTFRYRELTSSRDAEAVKALRVELGGDSLNPRRRRAAKARAEIDAPRQVQADEGEAPHHELVRRLREGELAPTDLVLSGGTWTTFSTAPEFYEVCAEQDEFEQDDGQRTMKLVAAAGVLMVALLLWLLRSH